MLFLQFLLYSLSFVGALKNDIPEAALELCWLKIKQLSPDIVKFRTKHEDNPFTFNCSVFSHSFLFVFHAGWHGLGSKNSRNSSYKEKTVGSARVSRLSLRFLWLCFCVSCKCNLVFTSTILSVSQGQKIQITGAKYLTDFFTETHKSEFGRD